MTEIVSGDVGQVRRRLRVVPDPSQAVRPPGQEPPPVAVYVRNRLLVSGFPGAAKQRHFDPLATALGHLGLRPRVTATWQRRIDGLQCTRGPARSLLDEIWVTSVELETDGRGHASPPDAWEVLQRLRHDDPDVAATLSLEPAIRPARWGRPSSTSGVAGLLPRRDSGRCAR